MNPFSKRAKENTLFRALKSCIVVHYSCESFDTSEFHKPKIIYLIRAEDGIQSDCQVFIFDGKHNHSTEIEKFYSYLQKYSGYAILHWRMVNDSFGFTHLENFAKSVNVVPYKIPDHSNINVKKILELQFPQALPHHISLLPIFQRNNLDLRDLIQGEAEALMSPENPRLKRSTYCKTDNILSIAIKARDNTLNIPSEKSSKYSLTSLKLLLPLLHLGQWLKVFQ